MTDHDRETTLALAALDRIESLESWSGVDPEDLMTIRLALGGVEHHGQHLQGCISCYAFLDRRSAAIDA
ncbi:hypothetical protein [Clavibacter capsici]|uniref:hypothetical protein n=1 Tax=Clavibacter capsici TaxID=1874630 RepID=UPI0014286053|nr:hypothetical protein [Clavibacter capsici]QIS38656.1 hypothetical protein GW572_04585 [Clavibacter capsici]